MENNQFEDLKKKTEEFKNALGNTLNGLLSDFSNKLKDNPEQAIWLRDQIKQINVQGSAFDLKKAINDANNVFKK